ncbi:MAG TPA: hypothetical protein VEB66_02130 [Opitutaceae bacterium]|nr:hypothetical protein [Opitutaceae bacterium]
MKPIAFLAFFAAAGASFAETGPARADRLLAAMGGREAWARVTYAHVEAVHDDLGVPAPFTNKIWNDFSRPRVRFEAKNAQLDSQLGIHDGRGWRRRNGAPAELTADRLAGEQRWWESNIYRTLHRLATGDSGLEARAVGDHRLEIFRSDGVRLNWFLLHPSGAPMLFGTWDSEAGTVFGPLATNGTIKYPRWGARPDGSWRYEIVRLVTGETVPADVDFTQP